jgi:hypothetical protein
MQPVFSLSKRSIDQLESALIHRAPTSTGCKRQTLHLSRL